MCGQEKTVSVAQSQIADEAKSLGKLELLNLMQHYQWGDEANLHWMPADEWFKLTELLLAAWRQGRIHNLFPSELEALRLITRVAEHNWCFKRQGAAKLPTERDDDRLLVLSHISPHPEPRFMSLAMNAALRRRDHDFFRRLAAQLKRKPVILREMQPELVSLAFKHWATEYRCPDGTIIPPLVELDDKGQRNFLMVLKDWKGSAGQFARIVVEPDQQTISTKVVRDLLKDFPRLPLRSGQKKPHRKGLSKDILRKIRSS